MRNSDAIRKGFTKHEKINAKKWNPLIIIIIIIVTEEA